MITDLVAALTLLVPASDATAQAPDALITIHVGRVLGPVNKLVFGGNVSSYDPYMIFGAQHRYSSTDYGHGLWDPDARRCVGEPIALAKAIGMSIARFPGGCGVHGFDWKKTVGPADERPHHRFGLNEFMLWCAQVGCEVVITVSDYTGTAQDAADLVEYLNCPADEEHPWARRRAANGHPEPYGVQYFELGNESDHGNHQLKPHKKFSAQEYGRWACQYCRTMKAVDPSIKIGAIMATDFDPDNPWNPVVLRAVKNDVDFMVVHHYWVGYAANDGRASSETLMRAALASTEQSAELLRRHLNLIRSCCGRDLPLAVTEYNGGFVQEKPVRYRFALGTALSVGDWLRVLTQPKNRILMANYWQFVNGYWGELRGPITPAEVGKVPWVKYPTFYVHWLYAKHFGDLCVASTCRCPAAEFGGFSRVARCRGNERIHGGVPLSGNLLSEVTFKPTRTTGCTLEQTRRGLAVAVSNLARDAYPAFAQLPAKPNTEYRFDGEVRVIGESKLSFGVQIGDGRGWPATRSARAQDGLEIFREWRAFQLTYPSLADTRSVQLAVRLRGTHSGPVVRMEMRRLRLLEVQREQFPAVPLLTVNASKSADGRKLFAMVINRSPDRDLSAGLSLSDFRPAAGRTWTLTGPTLHATNEKDPNICTVGERVLRDLEVVTLPARSMTAIELIAD